MNGDRFENPVISEFFFYVMPDKSTNLGFMRMCTKEQKIGQIQFMTTSNREIIIYIIEYIKLYIYIYINIYNFIKILMFISPTVKTKYIKNSKLSNGREKGWTHVRPGCWSQSSNLKPPLSDS